MRKPLPGWEARRHGGGLFFDAGRFRLIADSNGEWDVSCEGADGAVSVSLAHVQFAAEDAARAMVADMAKALGGSVTWGVPCPGCGTTEPDIAGQCGRCGMIGTDAQEGSE